MEKYTTPGTAGLTQRISSKYTTSEEKMYKETGNLFALMQNELMPCAHNQY